MDCRLYRVLGFRSGTLFRTLGGGEALTSCRGCSILERKKIYIYIYIDMYILMYSRAQSGCQSSSSEAQ